MEDQPSFLIQSDTHEPFGIRVLDIHFSIANISLYKILFYQQLRFHAIV
jgi:hypothetical protein